MASIGDIYITIEGGQDVAEQASGFKNRVGLVDVKLDPIQANAAFSRGAAATSSILETLTVDESYRLYYTRRGDPGDMHWWCQPKPYLAGYSLFCAPVSLEF